LLDSDKSIEIYLDFGMDASNTDNPSELILLRNFVKPSDSIVSKI